MTWNESCKRYFCMTNLYLYSQRGLKLGEIEIIATIANEMMWKVYLDLTSTEKVTSILVKMSSILLTLLLMSFPYNCFAAEDNNTGGLPYDGNVSK